MIIDLPQDFVNQIDAKSRKPVQLMEFLLPNRTYYLSDMTIGKGQGLLNDYEPWVESWGTLNDNTSLTSIFEGNSLEIKSATISLIVAPASRTFIKELFAFGIENTSVNLYQWFFGMTSQPVLIDTFVCQDPIEQTEATMLLAIDLVSPLMNTNPYLWAQAEGYDNQSVVIGKAKGLPLKDLQTERKTAIAQDIAYDYLGSLFIDNGVGFASSGVISIDSEDITYSAVTASSINITARAQNGTTARPHLRGAVVVPYGGIYDFSICSGPVTSVDNLVANGEPYLNDVEFFPGQNPVIARFVGRPPWLKVAEGQDGDPIVPNPVTSNEFASRTENKSYDGAPEIINSAAINSASGAATMAITLTNGSGGGVLLNRVSTATDSHNINSTGLLPTQLQGLETYEIPYMQTNTAVAWAPITRDSTSAHIDHIYEHDDSSWGNLSAVTAKVTFYGCEIRYADAKVEVIFVNVSGGITVLDTETINEFNGDEFGDKFKFHYNTFSYDVKSLVNNFEDLALCRIRIRYTNIRINASKVSATDYTRISWGQTKWDVGYFVSSINPYQPAQLLAAHFNRDLSSLGVLTNVTAKVFFSSTLTNAETNLIIFWSSSSWQSGSLETLWETNISGNLTGVERSFDLGALSWSELQNLRIGVKQTLTGPDTPDITRTTSTSFNYVKYQITYQPNDILTPDEERVVYAETLVCDVVSTMGEDPTPAQVVQHIITNHSDSSNYLDISDFNIAHENYVSVGYYLNGILKAGIKLHGALKQILREGMCRLLFNQGKIKLLTYFEEQSSDVDMVVSLDDILLRSRKTDNQPTSIIKNDITVLYNKDYATGVFNNHSQEENPSSVAAFFRKEHRRELDLVDSASIAQLHIDRLLYLLSTPNSIYSFNMFMRGYTLEKGDRITTRQFLDPRFSVTGNILSIERTFGKGKNQQINLFNVKISNPEVRVTLELEDSLIVDDRALSVIKGLLLKDTVVVDDSDFSYTKEFLLTEETIIIQDTVYLESCIVNGHGTCGHGVHGNGE